MKKLWADFKKFITRGNVVDMAVGVAVASAFTAIVTAFTKGFISPLLALLTGNSTLDDLTWVVKEAILDEAGEVLEPAVEILWGTFLQKVIDFFIIAFVLFLMLRIATAVMAHSKKIHEGVLNALTNEDEKQAEAERLANEAEEKAKTEALELERAAEEKAKAEALALEQEKEKKAKDEEERRIREIELLSEIRDLLKKQ